MPGTPLADALPGINACVHCGFCLQACPTYLNLEDENDSPRGRIFLMRSLLEGTVKPDDPSVQQQHHTDQRRPAEKELVASGVGHAEEALDVALQLLDLAALALLRVEAPAPVDQGRRGKVQVRRDAERRIRRDARERIGAAAIQAEHKG